MARQLPDGSWVRYDNDAGEWVPMRNTGPSAQAALPPPTTTVQTPTAPAQPYPTLPQGQGGRTIGVEQRAGLEGKHASNLFDITPQISAQELYQQQYDRLAGRQDPIAAAVQQQLLREGQLATDRANQTAQAIGGLAGDVAAYGPAAAQFGMGQAGQMNELGRLMAAYGPQAVQGALGASGLIGQGAGALGALGGAQVGQYNQAFAPINQQIADFASNYDTPERRAAEAQRSMATVADQFRRQREAATQRLASMGIDPSMGRGQQTQYDIGQATAQAAAADAARRQVEATGVGLRGQAAQLGQGIAAQGAGNIGTGMQGQNLAGNMALAGYGLGGNLAGGAANIAQGAGALGNQALGTAANIGATSGGMLTDAGRLGLQGSTQGSNIGLGGLNAGLSAMPAYGAGQGASGAATDIMQNWNQGIWGTQGNRLGRPSALAQAGGAFLGNVASGFIPTVNWNIGGGEGGGGSGGFWGGNNADGGYLYSTKQRFADGGGVLISGIPADTWLQNAPVKPALADGGPVAGDCRLRGRQWKRPDGKPCAIRPAHVPSLADGGLLGPVARGLLRAPRETPRAVPTPQPTRQPTPGLVPEAKPTQLPPYVQPTIRTEPGGPALVNTGMIMRADGSGQVDGRQGGHIRGPSDGTGIDDTVDIKAAPGEVIVPASVVAAKGTEFFDKLKAKYHMPAQQQRALGVYPGAGAVV